MDDYEEDSFYLDCADDKNESPERPNWNDYFDNDREAGE